MNESTRYIRIETAFSAIGTIAASILMFLLVFGFSDPLPARGFGAYAFDFVPQAFMTALLCTWLPGAITRRRIQRGTLPRADGSGSRISSLFLRGLTYGLAALLCAAIPAGLAIAASGAQSIEWGTGLVGKILFGGALAMIVTPIGLRAILREPASAQ